MVVRLVYKNVLVLGLVALIQACDSTSVVSGSGSPPVSIGKVSGQLESNVEKCDAEQVYSIVEASSDSAHDSGYAPALSIDGDLDVESRWSSNGDPRSIVLDMGTVQLVSGVRTAWYKADQREAYFDLQTSTNNSNWTTVITGASATGSEGYINFRVQDSEARYVRIVGHGNSSSDWNSLIEVEVFGCGNAAEETESVELSIVDASSDDSHDAYFSPALAIDGNLDSESRWSSNGDPRSMVLDLGKVQWVSDIRTAWYKADDRRAFFDVETSIDNRNWSAVLSDATATGTEGFIGFDVRDSQARYVRIVGHGNSSSSWNSLIEIEVYGCSVAPGGADSCTAGSGPVDPGPTAPGPVDPGPTAPGPVDPGPTAPGPVDPDPVDPDPVDPDPVDPDPVDPGPTAPGPVTPSAPLPPTVLNRVPDIECTIEVSSKSQLEDNTGWSMSPGTTVCLLDGTYSDVEFEIGGSGTESRPITVAAKNPGKVFIEGDSQVRMSGSYVVFQGFIFRDGNSADGDLFQTRGNSSRPCDNCRITENTVVDWDKEFEDSNKWLLIYGQNNRIDHNWFSGKTTRGALLIVDRGEISDPDYAQIDHNYFGDRPPFSGGEYPADNDNEFEGIRLGTSDTQAYPSYTRVEYNYMERIRGEAEIISNKSGSNVISNNTIRSSYGAIVNRHGGDTIISNNFIFSDGYGKSSGIRISGAGHQVTNNYIEGCTFSGHSFHGGIVLARTDGSQDTSGYQQVDNVLIAHNTLVDCVDSIRLDGGRSSSSTLPRNVSIINNVVVDARGPIFVGDIPPTTTFHGNYFGGDSLGLGSTPDGVIYGDPSFTMSNDGLYRPSANSPVVGGGISDYGNFPSVTIDMDGQGRINPDSGADEVSRDEVTMRPLTATDVGPLNYRP